MGVEASLNSFFLPKLRTVLRKLFLETALRAKDLGKIINLVRMQVLTLNHGHWLRARSWVGSQSSTSQTQ